MSFFNCYCLGIVVSLFVYCFCIMKMIYNKIEIWFMCMFLFFVLEYYNMNGLLKIIEIVFIWVVDIFLNGGKELGYKIYDCNGNDGD